MVHRGVESDPGKVIDFPWEEVMIRDNYEGGEPYFLKVSNTG